MADVGIVMPVYRQRRAHLQAALASVLQQSYADFQLVIVLDGTPEKERRIVMEGVRGDRRAHIVSLPGNSGVANALNVGFKRLRVRQDIQYYTWVSGDNVYYPHFVARLRQNLEKGPDSLGLVYSCYRPINDHGRSLLSDMHVANHVKLQDQPKGNLLDSCFIGASFMYKREYADKLEGYWAQPVEDYEFWLRLTEICDIQYIPEFLMDYRVASKHSLSKQLHESPARHRQWRYMFHSVKHAARRRRGILYETTVIFPLADASLDLESDYEFLLEQSYSNFRIILVDTSETSDVSKRLLAIPDPRVECALLPKASIADAIRVGLRDADTPYTLVYGSPLVHPLSRLHVLAQALRNAPGQTAAVSCDGSARQLISSRDILPPEDWHYNELCRTHILRRCFDA